MPKLDLSDLVMVLDLVVPAANEARYTLDGWSAKEKGSTRTVVVTLTRDLEYDGAAAVNGHTEAEDDAAPARKPSGAQVQRIHHSAEQDARQAERAEVDQD